MSSSVQPSSVAAPLRLSEFSETYPDAPSPIALDRELKTQVQNYLVRFRLGTVITPEVMQRYMRQFYIHVVQHSPSRSSALIQGLKGIDRLDHRNQVLAYILGFELIKMLFQMSWQQHERLYDLQRNQEDFLIRYIRPVQRAHQLNHVVVPRDQDLFFARRDYFVQRPRIPAHKLEVLAIATFTAETVLNFGFEVVRHPDSFRFDYAQVFEVPEMHSLGLA
jgi:hypothetical protein